MKSKKRKKYQLVIDTNVLVSALRSQRGAAYRLFMLLGSEQFEINLSVPLALEYEAAAKRLIGTIALTAEEIDDILDYICAIAHRRKIFYLWRPYLRDPKDDMVLELTVTTQCDIIVTYNIRDFERAEDFGIKVITAKRFLEMIGELPRVQSIYDCRIHWIKLSANCLSRNMSRLNSLLLPHLQKKSPLC